MEPDAAHKNCQNPYDDITDNLGDSKMGGYSPPIEPRITAIPIRRINRSVKKTFHFQ